MLSSLIESLLQNYCYFLIGQNDLTNEMDKVWNDPEVVNLCNNDGCVAIKMAANR